MKEKSEGMKHEKAEGTEAREHSIMNKLAKRKIKNMDKNKQKMSGKHVAMPPKTGRNMNPGDDVSGGARY